MLQAGRPGDVQFFREFVARDLAWPLEVASVECGLDDFALSAGEPRRFPTDLGEATERHLADLAELLNDVLQVGSVEEEDVVHPVGRRDVVPSPHDGVVLVDGGVRATGRLRDGDGSIVQSLGVVDVVGGLQAGVVLVDLLARCEEEGDLLVVEFLDVDVEFRAVLVGELREDAGLLLLEV